MARKTRYQNRIELLQGTLDLLVLQTLQWGPRHGYGITQAIRTRSDDFLQVDTGSLYPPLHRLERARFIAAEWSVSANNQRVRASPDRCREAAVVVGAFAVGQDVGRHCRRP